MYTSLNVFKAAHALATHAGQRQSVVAQNVANADTPGYKAQDIAPFSEIFGNSDPEGSMRATRSGHSDMTVGSQIARFMRSESTETDPNGNSVSVELEMLKAVEVSRQHEKAVTIYKSSLGILRSSLGRF